MENEKRLPPGQKKIPRFIIYAELGIPKVDLESYRLVIDGLVRNKVSLSYKELKEMIDTEYVEDFHCVTGWSVENVRWRGVSMKKILELVQPLENAKYLYLISLDGYTTVVDIDSARDEKAILALEINGKPLSIEQGFPLRIFIPKLYGWKSAKWLQKILFVDRYVDGYWEARGYHERGYVWDEERFKSGNSRHLPRRIYR
ncbi:MAG: sulfite oxidase-like oxidoreductase [Sulfolobales archaeon]